jgi:hypothetical protein
MGGDTDFDSDPDPEVGGDKLRQVGIRGQQGRGEGPRHHTPALSSRCGARGPSRRIGGQVIWYRYRYRNRRAEPNSSMTITTTITTT